MIQIRELDHLVLRVRDLDAMLRFYRDMLGCEVIRRVESLGLVQLRAGRSMLDLVPVDGALGRAGGAAPGAEGRNVDHFCLRVEPFDEAAIRETLARFGCHGGPVEQRVGAEGKGPSIYVSDPESNVVELKGPPGDTPITLEEGSTAHLPPAARLAGSNCGTEGVWRYAGSRPGPQVVISALMHGNEVCGAVALERLLRDPPAIAHGSLTLVFCNLRAYGRLDDSTKAECRFVDEDMNRVWGRLDAPAGASDTYEVRRAREILPFFESADVLVDLHSMTSPAEALGLVGRAARNVELARRIGFPALLVQDTGHASGLRLIDRPRFADANGAAAAMLVECGQHFGEAAMAAAHEVVARTVAACLQGRACDAPRPQVVIEVTEAVTIRSEAFAFVRDWPNMAVVPEAGTLVARDGDREVRTPHPDTYLVMPASEAFRKPGLTAVRFARRVPSER